MKEIEITIKGGSKTAKVSSHGVLFLCMEHSPERIEELIRNKVKVTVKDEQAKRERAE